MQDVFTQSGKLWTHTNNCADTALFVFYLIENRERRSFVYGDLRALFDFDRVQYAVLLDYNIYLTLRFNFFSVFNRLEEIKTLGYNIDLCGYPHEEEEILPPQDLIKQYREKRASLDANIDRVLAEIMTLLGENNE